MSDDVTEITCDGCTAASDWYCVKCWNGLVRELHDAEVQRDALRVEVGRLTAQLKSITAENHSRAQREARSLEEWVNLRAELEAARAALGAAWCGGTLAEGITRKYRWLETLINGVETP